MLKSTLAFSDFETVAADDMRPYMVKHVEIQEGYCDEKRLLFARHLVRQTIDICVSNAQAIQALALQIRASVVSPPCIGNAGLENDRKMGTVLVNKCAEFQNRVWSVGAAG